MIPFLKYKEGASQAVTVKRPSSNTTVNDHA